MSEGFNPPVHPFICPTAEQQRQNQQKERIQHFHLPLFLLFFLLRFDSSNLEILSSSTALRKSCVFSFWDPASASDLAALPFLFISNILKTFSLLTGIRLAVLEASYENHIIPFSISVFIRYAFPSSRRNGSLTFGNFSRASL